MVFTQYVEEDMELLKLLFKGMHLLEDSYLGGSGSRGSGEVKFKDINIYIRDREYYLEEKDQKKIENIKLEDIVNRFNEIIS